MSFGIKDSTEQRRQELESSVRALLNTEMIEKGVSYADLTPEAASVMRNSMSRIDLRTIADVAYACEKTALFGMEAI